VNLGEVVVPAKGRATLSAKFPHYCWGRYITLEQSDLSTSHYHEGGEGPQVQIEKITVGEVDIPLLPSDTECPRLQHSLLNRFYAADLEVVIHLVNRGKEQHPISGAILVNDLTGIPAIEAIKARIFKKYKTDAENEVRTEEAARRARDLKATSQKAPTPEG